jgi:hypothetical protein
MHSKVSLGITWFEMKSKETICHVCFKVQTIRELARHIEERHPGNSGKPIRYNLFAVMGMRRLDRNANVSLLKLLEIERIITAKVTAILQFAKVKDPFAIMHVPQLIVQRNSIT